MRLAPAGLMINIAKTTAEARAILVPTTRAKTQSPSGPCSAHSDCDTDEHFCAVACFTGSCGKDRSVQANTVGLFCQPCEECINGRSLTGRCDMCTKTKVNTGSSSTPTTSSPTTTMNSTITIAATTSYNHHDKHQPTTHTHARTHTHICTNNQCRQHVKH